MKILFKSLFVFFIILNLLIIISGKSWIYKGISITYLKGHASSYINDFIYFPANIIESGEHQEWKIAADYNSKKTPNFINLVNDSLETVSFMIIIDDSIKHEQYWHGYSADTMSNSYSISKSFVSSLIGIAIKEKKIKSVEQKVCEFLPSFCQGKSADLTIKDLLSMSAGLNWVEDYYNPIGEAAEAYYSSNLKELIMSLKVVESPGKAFNYQSACTQLLTFILERSVEKTISEYASEKLWKIIGAKHPALWSTDISGGDEKGFCCINSNARDFARLGKLYLQQGSWNGNQLLDSSYVTAATSAANLIDKNGDKNVNYGYHFWVCRYKEKAIYYARGLWGQYIICIPEKNMIIVRLGRKYGTHLEDGHYSDFYTYVDAALEMYP